MVHNIANALRSRGFEPQAAALEQDTQARLAAVGLSLDSVLMEPAPPQQGTLRVDEVEWINATSAECPYCGSTATTH